MQSSFFIVTQMDFYHQKEFKSIIYITPFHSLKSVGFSPQTDPFLNIIGFPLIMQATEKGFGLGSIFNDERPWYYIPKMVRYNAQYGETKLLLRP